MKCEASIFLYDSLIENYFKELAKHKLTVALVTTNYAPELRTHSSLSDLEGEVKGSGYQRVVLTNVHYVRVENKQGRIATIKADAAIFKAISGSWTARRWVLFDDSVDNKQLIACGVINSENKDVVITDGNKLTLEFSEGIFGIALG